MVKQHSSKKAVGTIGHEEHGDTCVVCRKPARVTLRTGYPTPQEVAHFCNSCAWEALTDRPAPNNYVTDRRSLLERDHLPGGKKNTRLALQLSPQGYAGRALSKHFNFGAQVSSADRS